MRKVLIGALFVAVVAGCVFLLQFVSKGEPQHTFRFKIPLVISNESGIEVSTSLGMKAEKIRVVSPSSGIDVSLNSDSEVTLTADFSAADLKSIDDAAFYEFRDVVLEVTQKENDLTIYKGDVKKGITGSSLLVLADAYTGALGFTFENHHESVYDLAQQFQEAPYRHIFRAEKVEELDREITKLLLDPGDKDEFVRVSQEYFREKVSGAFDAYDQDYYSPDFEAAIRDRERDRSNLSALYSLLLDRHEIQNRLVFLEIQQFDGFAHLWNEVLYDGEWIMVDLSAKAQQVSS